MIRSMTGFGSVSDVDEARQFSVEIRALNGKHLKCHIRLPEELSGLEPELEPVVNQRLSRGTVTVTVRHQDNSSHAAADINQAVLQKYVDQLTSIDGVTVDAATLLQLPGVLVQNASEDGREFAIEAMKRLVAEACDAVISMRTSEGVQLRADLELHLASITESLSKVEARIPEVNQLFSDRLRTRMQSMLSDLGVEVRDEDLIREVAVFSEKSDVAEEVNRLRGHLDQFGEILEGDGNAPVGRTLDFLTQEMLREANTMGSKCLDPTVSRSVVSIKGAIDRIKEQVQNVE